MPSLNEESKPYQEQEDAYSIIEKEAQQAKKEPTVDDILREVREKRERAERTRIG